MAQIWSNIPQWKNEGRYFDLFFFCSLAPQKNFQEIAKASIILNATQKIKSTTALYSQWKKLRSLAIIVQSTDDKRRILKARQITFVNHHRFPET